MIPVGNKKTVLFAIRGYHCAQPPANHGISPVGDWLCRMECLCGGLVAWVDASPYGDGLMCSRGLSAAIPTGRKGIIYVSDRNPQEDEFR